MGIGKSAKDLGAWGKDKETARAGTRKEKQDLRRRRGEAIGKASAIRRPQFLSRAVLVRRKGKREGLGIRDGDRYVQRVLGSSGISRGRRFDFPCETSNWDNRTELIRNCKIVLVWAMGVYFLH